MAPRNHAACVGSYCDAILSGDIIAGREEDFAHGFTEHLIEYALGRPFGFTDEDLANEIVSSARSKEFAVSAFIHSLVQTRAFRTK